MITAHSTPVRHIVFIPTVKWDVGMVVLNIDDDRDDLEIFCDAIKEIDPGIKCVAKQSAEEAIHYLLQTDKLPNYIFLDINMPLMGGKACLNLIKKHQKLSHIPVIMLSTTTNPREIDEVKRMGADFMNKQSIYSRYVSTLKQKIYHIM
jgi:CheY-like chemotaxis protein